MYFLADRFVKKIRRFFSGEKAKKKPFQSGGELEDS